MLFLIEVIPLERAFVIICYVFAFVVYAFENMKTWSALYCFKSQWVELGVSLAAPCHIPVVLKFMESVTLLASGSVSSIGES